ncbi:MAG: hypothetical protein SNJ57_19445 [Cyanobacteriota bacterium]
MKQFTDPVYGRHAQSNIGFTPIPDHSAPLLLESIVVGRGWVPPCAKSDRHP